MHGVVGAVVGAPKGTAEEFSRRGRIVSGRMEVLHLGAEVKTFVEVSREEKTKVILPVSAYKTAFVGDGGIGGGGIEEPLLLGCDDVGLEPVREGVIDGGGALPDDTGLDGRYEDVSIHRAGGGVAGLDVEVVIIEHEGISERYRVRDGTEVGHTPGARHGLDTRRFGSGHKGRCQQH